MDGWGIVQGDLIQLSGNTQRARITSVNYSTKVITVDTSLTWTQNQGVALAYEGSSPDAGAIEYSTTTPTPTATPGSTVTPTPIPTPSPTSTPTPGGISFDANQGIITYPFVINGNTISQLIQTVDPTQGGRALYTFNVQTSGDYLLSAMVNCPDDGSNSFFVNIDAEPSSTMVWNIAPTVGFGLRIASWPPGTTPKAWTLAAGTHQLIIRGREANAVLQHITLGIAPLPPEGLHVVP